MTIGPRGGRGDILNMAFSFGFDRRDGGLIDRAKEYTRPLFFPMTYVHEVQVAHRSPFSLRRP